MIGNMSGTALHHAVRFVLQADTVLLAANQQQADLSMLYSKGWEE